MIPEDEFKDEITSYIRTFIQASKACAELITNLARATSFDVPPPLSEERKAEIKKELGP